MLRKSHGVLFLLVICILLLTGHASAQEATYPPLGEYVLFHHQTET